jgi:hypothetical protein
VLEKADNNRMVRSAFFILVLRNFQKISFIQYETGSGYPHRRRKRNKTEQTNMTRKLNADAHSISFNVGALSLVKS